MVVQRPVKSNYKGFSQVTMTRFLSSPIITRVSFLLLLGVSKGTLKEKGQKGTTHEPRQGFHKGNDTGS